MVAAAPSDEVLLELPEEVLPHESVEMCPEPSPEERRELVLRDAKDLLKWSRHKGWECQVSELEGTSSLPAVERLSEEELDESMARAWRSRSVDLSLLSREKYLSRWSRENTPVDSGDSYQRHIRRSFTPVRDVAGFQTVEDERRPLTSIRARTPLGTMTTPYHTNITYRSENEPLRKYDVFQVRSWSYPIYKYIYGRDTHSTRPYSYSRAIGTTPVYTPPQMTPESTPITTRRSYSGYAYLACENNYDVSSRPRSLQNYNLWRAHLNVSPYFSSTYHSSSLRHFNSYRPRPFTTRLSTYYSPYY